MSVLFIFALCSLCACAGYFLGVGMRNSAFASQPWKLLRWDENILGYRVIPENYKLAARDRVMMAVEVNAEMSEAMGDYND